MWLVLLYKHSVDIAVILDILLAHRTVDGKAKYGNVQQQNYQSVVNESLRILGFSPIKRSRVFAGWEKFKTQDLQETYARLQTLQELKDLHIPFKWDRRVWCTFVVQRMKRVILGSNGKHAIWYRLYFMFQVFRKNL